MTKPKHPTAKTLRQGQTIYSLGYNGPMHAPYTVHSFFVQSQKAPPPEPYVSVSGMPVNFIRENNTHWSSVWWDIFYSRRRAEAKAKRLNRPYMQFHGWRQP